MDERQDANKKMKDDKKLSIQLRVAQQWSNDRLWLNRNSGWNVRVWVVIFELEVFKLEREEIFHLRIDAHLGKCTRGAGELQLRLFQMIEIKMGVASGVDEFSGLEVAHLCHHHGEKCIGRNVERNAQEGVRAALIEL